MRNLQQRDKWKVPSSSQTRHSRETCEPLSIIVSMVYQNWYGLTEGERKRSDLETQEAEYL